MGAILFINEEIMSAKKYIPFVRTRVIDSHPELPIDPDIQNLRRWRWPPHFHPYLMGSVFIGGCGGAITRYLITQALPPTASGWPLSTLCVNLTGSFALGFLLEFLARFGIDKGFRRILRLMIGTGFIGAYTTYSTFALDIHSLYTTSPAIAASYSAITLAGGIALSGFGIQLAAIHHKRRGLR